MALYFHSSNNVEYLLSHFCKSKKNESTSIQAAFLPKIILLQSNGMRRWISLKIAEIQGICANHTFLFPNAIIQRITEAIVTNNHADLSPTMSEDLYQKQYLKWKIFQKLIHLKNLNQDDAHRYHEISSYLNNEVENEKCYYLSNLLADVFDQYLVYRPEELTKWENNNDITHWQAQLWNDLKKQLGNTHRQARLQNLYSKLANQKKFLQTNYSNIMVFGISTLPPYIISFLQNLSQYINIDFYFFNPFNTLVENGNFNIHKNTHGFIRSLATEGQELIKLFQEDKNILFQHHYQPTNKSKNLLSLLKNYLMEGSGEDRAIFNQTAYEVIKFYNEDNFSASADLSLQIHEMHSRISEVTLLQQRLLFLLSEKKYTLNDIIVMAPDIELYAPYIQAIFSQVAELNEKNTRIPFHIVDRSIKSENAVLTDMFSFLDFLTCRWEMSEVMNFLSIKSISKKLKLSLKNLNKIHHLLEKAGVRWSWDGATPEDVEAEDSLSCGLYSWQMGINRLLAHYGIFQCFSNEADEHHYDYKLDTLEDVFGEVIYFLTHINKEKKAWCTPVNLADWANRLKKCASNFFDFSDYNAADVEAFNTILEKLNQEQHVAKFEEKISFSVLKKHLELATTQTVNDAGFFIGSLTFCSMLPMRSIPFKVVCILGLEGNNFPRKDVLPDFSYLKKETRLGDRSKRKDDLYLFLETLYSVQEMLWISFVGYDSKTKNKLPMSTVVSDCVEVVNEIFEHAIRTEKYQKEPLIKKKLDDKLIIEHPPHQHNPFYFKENSYFPSYLQKKLSISKKIGESNFSSINSSIYDYFHKHHAPLLAKDYQTDISVQEIVNFFKNPTKQFYEQYFCAANLEVEHRQMLDIEPCRLQEHSLQWPRNSLAYKMLEENLHSNSDIDLFEWRKKYQEKIKRPLFYFGENDFTQFIEDVASYRQLLQQEGTGADLSLNLPIEYELNGKKNVCSVTDSVNVKETENEICLLFYHLGGENINMKFHAWISLLALSCYNNTFNTKAIIWFFKKKKQDNPKKIEITALNPTQAKELIEKIIYYYHLGKCYPLPFSLEGGAHYLKKKTEALKNKRPFNSIKTLKQTLEKYLFDKEYNSNVKTYTTGREKNVIYLEKNFGDLENKFLESSAVMDECLKITEEIMETFVQSVKSTKKEKDAK